MVGAGLTPRVGVTRAGVNPAPTINQILIEKKASSTDLHHSIANSGQEKQWI